MKQNWQAIALGALAALVAGYLIGQAGFVPKANAQMAGESGRAICLIGPIRGGYAPIVLVDSLEQSVIVYEYNYDSRRLELKSVRTYQFDKLLGEFRNEGIPIAEVRRLLEGGR